MEAIENEKLTENDLEKQPESVTEMDINKDGADIVIVEDYEVVEPPTQGTIEDEEVLLEDDAQKNGIVNESIENFGNQEKEVFNNEKNSKEVFFGSKLSENKSKENKNLTIIIFLSAILSIINFFLIMFLIIKNKNRKTYENTRNL